MFGKLSAFDQDIGGWAVHSVADMSALFNAASAFNQDLGGWAGEPKRQHAMNGMFVQAQCLITRTLVVGRSTTSTNMNEMFKASSFNQDISGWAVHKVTDILQSLIFLQHHFVGHFRRQPRHPQWLGARQRHRLLTGCSTAPRTSTRTSAGAWTRA